MRRLDTILALQSAFYGDFFSPLRRKDSNELTEHFGGLSFYEYDAQYKAWWYLMTFSITTEGSIFGGGISRQQLLQTNQFNIAHKNTEALVIYAERKSLKHLDVNCPDRDLLITTST